jgi:hypothetical protein
MHQWQWNPFLRLLDPEKCSHTESLRSLAAVIDEVDVQWPKKEHPCGKQGN